MKKLILTLILITSLFGCKVTKDRYDDGYKVGYSTASTKDSLIIVKLIDSIGTLNTIIVADSIQEKVYIDSIKTLTGKINSTTITPTIQFSDYIAKKKIIRIENYIRICNKKPSNKKYFFGWVSRTIRQ